MTLSSITSIITSLITVLKDYIILGVAYYSGKTSKEKEVLEKVLKVETKKKQEYLKNAEDVARMSDAAIFDELHEKYTRRK
jgi:hypothetical protein